MADVKFKKGDTVFNTHYVQIGVIVKADKTPDNKNKYEIEMLDGSPNQSLEERFIHETEYHKSKVK